MAKGIRNLAKILALGTGLFFGVQNIEALTPKDYPNVKTLFGYKNKSYVIWNNGEVTSEKNNIKFTLGNDGKWHPSSGGNMAPAFKTEMDKALKLANKKIKEGKSVIDYFQRINPTNKEVNTLTIWSDKDPSNGSLLYRSDKNGWYVDANWNYVRDSKEVPCSKDLSNTFNTQIKKALNNLKLIEEAKAKPATAPTTAPATSNATQVQSAAASTQKAYDDTKIVADLGSLTSKVNSLEEKVKGLDNTQELNNIKNQLGELVRLYGSIKSYDDSKLVSNLNALNSKVSSLENAPKSVVYDDTELKSTLAQALNQIGTKLTSLEGKIENYSTTPKAVEIQAPIQTSVENAQAREKTIEQLYLEGGIPANADEVIQPQAENVQSDIKDVQLQSPVRDALNLQINADQIPGVPGEKVKQSTQSVQPTIENYNDYTKFFNEVIKSQLAIQDLPQSGSLEAVVSEEAQTPTAENLPIEKKPSRQGITILADGNASFGGFDKDWGYKSASGSLGVRYGFTDDFELGLVGSVGSAPDKIIESYTSEVSPITGRYGTGTRTEKGVLYLGGSAEMKIGYVILGGGVDYRKSLIETEERIMKGDLELRKNTNSIPNDQISGKAYAGLEFEPVEGWRIGAIAGYSQADGLYAGLRTGFRLNFEPSKE